MSNAPASFPDPPEALLLAVLDGIAWGVILCDGSGRIGLMNAAARRALAGGLALRMEHGVLAADGPGAEALTLALRDASRRDRRRLLRVGSDEAAVWIGIEPLPRVGAGGTPRVLVLMGRHAPCSEMSLSLLADGAGLTGAERRVLASLLRQETPRAIAHAHGVALSTVRSQIASIRLKLGVRNVDQLLLQLAGLPPFADALRMAQVWPPRDELRAAARA